MDFSEASLQLAELGVLLPEILVPRTGSDIGTWAVIACDQYSSEPEYWNKVSEAVGSSPSAFHCILPELYLDSPRAEEYVTFIIKGKMREYLDAGIFRGLAPGLVLVDRATPHHASRRGMVVALDMECYDFRQGTKSLIRPTERTIVERIPPRVKIRKGAALELPHIMVLMDDPKNEVLDPLFALAGNEEPVYQGELMLGSGHITGRWLSAEKAAPLLAESLGALRSRGRKHNLLFAMGDGNHSLATAKAVWEEAKLLLTAEQRKTHPLRYALVEIVNLYDPGIEFHPIHRILTGVNPAEFFAFLRKKRGLRLEDTRSVEETTAAMASRQEKNAFTAGLLSSREKAILVFKKEKSFLPTGKIQDLLEEFRRDKGGKIDYIHGEASLTALANHEDNVGILLPCLPRDKLFPVVIAEGVLPSKAFSLGEAPEKRFYIEARRIG
ncbi:MAG: DUF1015 domain-containing protein [Spirochaetaceae bacterium]|nr:DUF1015 domain-containing protein [Spirochaetaceae bacterium]